MCDRSVLDIVVEVMVDVNDDELYKKLRGQLLLCLMPSSSISVCLDVDEEIAQQRKGDIPEIGYLIRRRKAYRSVSRYLEIPIVNAEKAFVSVQQDLVALVEG